MSTNPYRHTPARRPVFCFRFRRQVMAIALTLRVVRWQTVLQKQLVAEFSRIVSRIVPTGNLLVSWPVSVLVLACQFLNGATHEWLWGLEQRQNCADKDDFAFADFHDAHHELVLVQISD